jgi:hypothetical protein
MSVCETPRTAAEQFVISLPWYLLAAGILIVILGFVLASLPGSSRSRGIDARMRDADIIRELDQAQRIPFPNLVIAFGLLCVLVSIVWRLVRYFV